VQPSRLLAAVAGVPSLLTSVLANTTVPFSLEVALRQIFSPLTPTILKTKTEPPFWLAMYRRLDGVRKSGPDGTWDPPAAAVLASGIYDSDITSLFYKAISGRCLNGSGVVVDVGGNMGYFTILSAMQGCRVHVWEGSPRHASMIYMSVWMNGLNDRVTIHNNICGTGSQPLAFSGLGADGHVAGSYLNSDNPNFQKVLGAGYRVETENDKSSGVLVHPLAIDTVIAEEVLLLKVDVEGYEPHVFKSAQRLLERGMVRYAVFEYNMWRAMTKAEGVQLVMSLISWGYSITTVPSRACKMEIIQTRDHIEELSFKLQNNTDACHMYLTNLLATRKDVAPLYV
jgi:FkbM family methyltransferase